MSALRADDPGVRALLRHALATLAYRAGKTVRGTPDGYADFIASPDSKSPRAILAHMGDLLDWTLRMARDGERKWTEAAPRAWEAEQARFFASLRALDDHFASELPIRFDPAVMFQGGIADALTHTGQLAMLRRLSGHKMKGENYSRAEIVSGRVGSDQAPPKPEHEFD